MARSTRFDSISVIVLMQSGQQNYTRAYNDPLATVGRAFRDALEQGPVREAVVVTSEGISKYTANEVAELAEHPSYS